ncbi:rhomboid family protein [Chryseobacterium sp. 6424]|uniref:DUF6576 domain-containing protein n=1 Tax=Chryseobacterium sp. 6424 TaxID=2039166 RepID=UPI000EFAAF23|nr:DUF6576 domain-containing protein [Chryseobacterium sp. 6424]AYO56812.1 rhomboid family protein [Chryseobacterium sp. 6424]
MEAILILAAVAIIFLFFRKRIRRSTSGTVKKYVSPDDQFNAERRERELEIDRLLGKMSENGTDDLTPKDKKRLEELSKKIK